MQLEFAALGARTANDTYATAARHALDALLHVRTMTDNCLTFWNSEASTRFFVGRYPDKFASDRPSAILFA